MRTRNLIYIATAFAAIACAKDITTENTNDVQQEVRLVPMTFQAGSEEDSESATKVTLGDDKKSVLWTETDQIKVFDKISNDLDAFTVSSGAGTTLAAISGSVSAEATGNFYAMYPYQADATFTSAETLGDNTVVDGYMTMVVPAEQKAVAGSLDPAAFIGVGQCTNGTTFNFKNATAFVKFQLNSADVEGLETVSFSGNSLGSVAGKINIGFMENGNVVQTIVSGGGVQYITLSKPEGGWKSEVDYYFAIRPLKFADGFTITARYSDNSCRHLTTSKGVTNASGVAQTVSRNCTMNLNTLPAMKKGLPNDLYIAYLHGQDIDIAGNIVNKTKYPSATLVTADKTIASGLFFINRDIKATINNVSQCIAIGRMADTKSIAQRTDSYLRLTPTANDDYFMLKNISLNIAYSANNAYLTALADNGTFEKIVFDDCKFEIPSNKTQIISAPKDRQINECVFNSCDIKISNTTGTGIYIINYASNYSAGTHNSTTMSNLTFHNNIVYEESDIKQFKIFYGKWAPVSNLSVTNNIFYNTYCDSEGYVINNKTENFTLENNIFYMPNWGEYAKNSSGVAQFWGFLRCHGNDTDAGKVLTNYPEEGKATAKNNYCYKTSGNTFKTSFADMKNNGTFYTNVANPTNGDTDPFTTKDTAIPSFVLSDSYAKYIGATR